MVFRVQGGMFGFALGFGGRGSLLRAGVGQALEADLSYASIGGMGKVCEGRGSCCRGWTRHDIQ